jgi:hypothetical protein
MAYIWGAYMGRNFSRKIDRLGGMVSTRGRFPKHEQAADIQAPTQRGRVLEVCQAGPRMDGIGLGVRCVSCVRLRRVLEKSCDGLPPEALRRGRLTLR